MQIRYYEALLFPQHPDMEQLLSSKRPGLLGFFGKAHVCLLTEDIL